MARVSEALAQPRGDRFAVEPGERPPAAVWAITPPSALSMVQTVLEPSSPGQTEVLAHDNDSVESNHSQREEVSMVLAPVDRTTSRRQRLPETGLEGADLSTNTNEHTLFDQAITTAPQSMTAQEFLNKEGDEVNSTYMETTQSGDTRSEVFRPKSPGEGFSPDMNTDAQSAANAALRPDRREVSGPSEHVSANPDPFVEAYRPLIAATPPSTVVAYQGLNQAFLNGRTARTAPAQDPTPVVRIGQIDVIVQELPQKMSAPTPGASPSSLASRRYLRRL